MTKDEFVKLWAELEDCHAFIAQCKSAEWREDAERRLEGIQGRIDSAPWTFDKDDKVISKA